MVFFDSTVFVGFSSTCLPLQLRSKFFPVDVRNFQVTSGESRYSAGS